MPPKKTPKPDPLVFAKDGKAIVESLGLEVMQGFQSQYDLLTGISYANQLPVIPVPPVYYAVRESIGDRFVILGFYHPYDPAAMHRHDFEGAIIRIDSEKEERDIITVCHHSFKRDSARSPYLFIEPHGHGIWPLFSPELDEHTPFPKAYIKYGAFDFVDMADWTPEGWAKLKKEFGPSVNTPHEWHDLRLEQWVKKYKPHVWGHTITTTKGLFWERPDILYELMDRYQQRKDA